MPTALDNGIRFFCRSALAGIGPTATGVASCAAVTSDDQPLVAQMHVKRPKTIRSAAQSTKTRGACQIWTSSLECVGQGR